MRLIIKRELDKREDYGCKVTFSKLMPSRISLMYTECERKKFETQHLLRHTEKIKGD